MLCVISAACTKQQLTRSAPVVPANRIHKPLPENASVQLRQLIEGANAQVGITVGYDPSYVEIAYPDGDVPESTGVCADVIVRAFRKAGIDLQKEIHEDMKRDRSAYSNKWGANLPDANIDHRRVLNLRTYFERQGKSLPVTNGRGDYLPGDVVTWDLGNGLDHIGLVSDVWSEDSRGCMVVHNIGAGTKVEDVLFSWKITGHYRFFH
jgi:uncharacterized protein YijF (DUF1287 family)